MLFFSNISIEQDEFVQWLDSEAPVLELSKTHNVLRCKGEIVDELWFSDIDCGGISRKNKEVAFLKKEGERYTVYAGDFCCQLSELSVFGDRVLLRKMSRDGNPLAADIFIAVTDRLFSGEGKLVEGGFLPALTFPNTKLQAMANKKLISGRLIATLIENPKLSPFYSDDSHIHELLRDFYKIVPSFFTVKIPELVTEAAIENSSRKYVINTAAQVVIDGVNNAKSEIDTNIAQILELNKAVGYLRKYFPATETQHQLVAYEKDIYAVLLKNNATRINLYYPSSDISIKDCSENDLSMVTLTRQKIGWSTALSPSLGIELCYGINGTNLTFSEAEKHPITITSNGLIPWTKIHHIEHRKKIIWKNPEIGD